MSTETENFTPEILAAIEAAFREGYAAGYKNGGSDQCSFEWGSGSGSDMSRKRDQDEEWRNSDAFKAGHDCPKCGNKEVWRSHHNADSIAPECDYWACQTCHHQWGFQ